MCIIKKKNGHKYMVKKGISDAQRETFTYYMWNYVQKKWVSFTVDKRKCNPFVIQMIREINQKKKSHINIASLMKHPVAKKQKTGSPQGSAYCVTDYECRKIPLHDFRFKYGI